MMMILRILYALTRQIARKMDEKKAPPRESRDTPKL
jgi:hypothetical protein